MKILMICESMGFVYASFECKAQHYVNVYIECALLICLSISLFSDLCLCYEWHVFIIAMENYSSLCINCCNGFSSARTHRAIHMRILRIFHRKFCICTLFSGFRFF